MRNRISTGTRRGFAAVCGVVSVIAVVAALPASAGSDQAASAPGLTGSAVSGAATATRHASKRITGKLDKPGYTVIALAAHGKARTVRARKGSFRIVSPAARVSLQLRTPNGKYAGPVVVGRKGNHTLMGVRRGTHLGKVVVHPKYARVAHRIPRAALDTSRWARARKGVPIGAGRFGRVRSKPPKHSPTADRDADGVPDVIDIDDDGDLVIDNVDRSKVARSTQALSTAQTVTPSAITIKSLLSARLFNTPNANSPDLVGAIPTALVDSGQLMIEVAPGDFVELDCGGANQPMPRVEGLIYCSLGGTGEAQLDDGTNAAFPNAFDPDGDGMGNLTPNPSGGGEHNTLMLLVRTTADHVGTGDVLVERITDNGAQSQLTGTVQYMFATVPALVAYDDGHGEAATVKYPVPWGGPGTEDNGIPVKAGANGHVVVTLTFWRPQRAPIPPESAPWIDMGRLSYGLGIQDTGLECPSGAFSDPSPSLQLADTEFDWAGARYTDQAGDHPANPANTLSFTVDLTKCLAAHGRSFDSGQTRGFQIEAKACGGDRCTIGQGSGPDQTNQTFTFTRQ